MEANRSIGNRDLHNNYRAPRHPGDGALQPLSTRVRHRPLCANRGKERTGPQVAVSSSSDGYLRARGLSLQYSRVREMGPEIFLTGTTMAPKTGPGPGAMGGAKMARKKTNP